MLRHSMSRCQWFARRYLCHSVLRPDPSRATLAWNPLTFSTPGHGRYSTSSYLSSLFSRAGSAPANTGEKGGVLGIPELTEAGAFEKLELKAREEVETLLEEALNPSRERLLVQILDDMSDSLCRVADMADCLRLLHPDDTYRRSAQTACAGINHLVELLNTHRPLYDVMKAGEEGALKERMDEIDRRVGDLFVADFELSGIHLDDKTRTLFVEASSAEYEYGAQFVQQCHEPTRLPTASLPPSLLSQLPSSAARAPTIVLSSALSNNPDPGMRRLGYLGFHAANPLQEETLQSLLAARQRVALHSGFSNYATRATRNTMAESPELVHNFLERLADRVAPLAERELAQMSQMVGGESKKVNVWDIHFLTATARAQMLQDGGGTTTVREMFSLEACLSGVSMVCRALFDVELEVERETAPGELWHPDVLKMVVREASVSKEHLGTIYCDFLQRPEKPLQDCHYTIRGGRKLADGTYQSPIVVLHLNLTPPMPPCPFSLLRAGQVENLFHEFGHALHSMLGRTRYQHVTGTRCPTDFAEVPSTLLEHFALDPRVTPLYAQHWKTGESIDQKLANRLAASRNVFASVEIQQQIVYALLDHHLHAKNPAPSPSWKLFHQLHDALLPSVEHSFGQQMETAWHHRFSHLVGYGSKYYSYLMSRSVAELLWQHLNADNRNPLESSSHGLAYRNCVLALGGERPPLQLVQNLTGKTPTVDGLVNALTSQLNCDS